MNRPEPLQPAYDFSPAPEPVRLLHGSAELEWRDKSYSGNADVLLQFLPSPRVTLHASLQGVTEVEAFRFVSMNREIHRFPSMARRLRDFL